MEKITLSPSKLSLMKDCPRCFFDAEALKIKPPRGIFPSLPGGIDRIMKTFFDGYRGDMPPMLKDKIPGVLYANAEQMRKWRYWRTAPRYYDPILDVEVYGAIDDLVIENSAHGPADYKTKGQPPKDDGSQYYMTQMDIYNLLFEHSGRKILEKAYIIYVWPKEARAHYFDGHLDASVIDIPFIVQYNKNN